MRPLIIVAPTAFKETLTPREAARAIERGVRRALPRARIVEIPVADGGDGTREVLSTRTAWARVLDPLGRPIRAPYSPDGIVEMADASGLKLLRPEERDPERTTTFGTGQLLRAALRRARRVLLGVGGSATVDGGAGALEALGDLRLCRRVTVLCDVTTRFLDAPRVFGPQKGATPAAVRRLEARLRAMNLPSRVLRRAGSGAAGGLAGGLAAHGARLVPGARHILRALRFRERARGADLVLTGEGKFDATSLAGKAVGEVLRASRRVVVLCGRSEIRKVPCVELRDGMRDPAGALARAAEEAVRSCRYRSW